MKETRRIRKSKQERSRIALITNHGYAGVTIPVGGAADTGGQNFYVNALAKALADLRMEVTVFTRGGFPFFESNKIREGEEKLSKHVTYVYIPGGGNEFIRKEDIAVALDEETVWLSRYICEKAQQANVEPWKYYDIINTHYWDAAIIGDRLVERWKDQIAYNFLKKAGRNVFRHHLAKFDGDERHRLNLSREIELHMGKLATTLFPDDSPADILAKLLGDVQFPDEALKSSADTPGDAQKIEQDYLLGALLVKHIKYANTTIGSKFNEADRHVWTPHSLGIIKERNFWHKSDETVRKLKFRERSSHEETICKHTRLFCSTSPEILQNLISHHNVIPSHVFDFPPCIDGDQFKPRTKKELTSAYKYLSEQSNIPVDTLKKSKIVFETSRMDDTKRKDILLKSFAEVVSKTDNTLLFIGGGPKDSEIFKQLQGLKESISILEGRAFLLGFIPSDILESLFSLPDLFVSASEMEGFGMSVSQAAAAGVAVVSSDLIPFATQYAKDSAVLVNAGDIKGFSDAITRLLNDDKERARRAAEIKTVADTLEWRSTARRFVGWFRSRHY